jgi:hypothetical protein
LVFSFFFFQKKKTKKKTFLLKAKGDETSPTTLARGERHPQRTKQGTPVRGGGTKKGGKGGKGTWLGDGSADHHPMRNGAIDRRDPNYSSSSSDEEPAVAVQRSASVSVIEQRERTQSGSAPTVNSSGGFKRIGLDQLFGGQQQPQQQQQQHPSKSVSAASVPAAATEKKEQYAGGAHHNIPEASTLPLPASLGNTPQKNRTSAASLVAHSPEGFSARQMEQSLKALLRIDGV